MPFIILHLNQSKTLMNLKQYIYLKDVILKRHKWHICRATKVVYVTLLHGFNMKLPTKYCGEDVIRQGVMFLPICPK
jgi:hypothetical protein